MTTGARRGEICGLRWSHVDLDHATLTIRRMGKPADDKSPYRRIAADLRGAIESGVLQPGDPLPTEEALADRYGVANQHRPPSPLRTDHPQARQGRPRKRAVVA